MRILSATPELLVIQDRAIGPRAFGALFVAIGIAALWGSVPVDGPPVLVGVLFVGAGLGFVCLPTTTLAFDRRAGQVTRELRWPRIAPLRRVVPLDRIRGVTVAQERDTQEQALLHRVVLSVEGEADLPFTPLWTTGAATKERIAQAIYSWLKGMPIR